MFCEHFPWQHLSMQHMFQSQYKGIIWNPKLLWTQVFFLTQNGLDPKIFLTQNVLSLKHFGLKSLIRSKVFLTPIFFGHNIFGQQLFLETKIVLQIYLWPNRACLNILGPILWETKMLWTQIFWANFLGPIFLDQKSFFDPKLSQTQNFLDTKNFVIWIILDHILTIDTIFRGTCLMSSSKILGGG